jgi:undecaprenyl diphosphate synthase
LILFSSFFPSIKVPAIKDLKKNRMPAHVAIIMDGNGRWAIRRKLPRSAGHREGVKALKKIIYLCLELEIKILTVYSFSSENWNRPEEEVNFLMGLFLESLRSELDLLSKNGVRVNLIGIREKIPPDVLKAFVDAEKKTESNNKLIFNIAFNYGSRQEIIAAVKKICEDAGKNIIEINKLNVDKFSDYLLTKGCPDPDLLIRTSGEYRLSNFLLWQLAYSEFYFVKTLWPDFKKKDFLKAIYYYQRRDRRFGRI